MNFSKIRINLHFKLINLFRKLVKDFPSKRCVWMNIKYSHQSVALFKCSKVLIIVFYRTLALQIDINRSFISICWFLNLIKSNRFWSFVKWFSSRNHKWDFIINQLIFKLISIDLSWKLTNFSVICTVKWNTCDKYS